MNLRLPVIAAIVTVATAAAAYRGFVHAPDAMPSAAPAGDLAFATPASAPEAPVEHRRGRPTVTVYVAGAVAHAGIYALPATARANDALRAAGGPSGDADLVAVNLAETLSDGEEIVVPVKSAADPADVQRSADGTRAAGRVRRAGHRKRRKHHKRRSAEAAGTSDSTDATGDAATSADPAGAGGGPTQIIDINSAAETELETLPGIGPSLASRIVTFRELNGPFSSADDLLDVNGMTQGRLDALAPYVVAK
jgi:competence protein ComEA